MRALVNTYMLFLTKQADVSGIGGRYKRARVSAGPQEARVGTSSGLRDLRRHNDGCNRYLSDWLLQAAGRGVCDPQPLSVVFFLG